MKTSLECLQICARKLFLPNVKKKLLQAYGYASNPPVLEKRRTKPSARLRDTDNDSEFQLTSHRQVRSHVESEISERRSPLVQLK